MTETSIIKIEIKLTKEKNKMYLHHSIIDGKLSDGRAFAVDDIGLHFMLSITEKNGDWTQFLLSKKDFFGDLIQKIMEAEGQ